MKVEGVIFDLDGTLVHTIDDIAGAANRMLARNGFQERALSDYLRWIGNGAIRLIELAIGKPLERDQLMSFVTEFKEIYGANLHDQSQVYHGISEVLDAITEAGIKISVLSNKPHVLTQQVASYYLSQWPFEPVYGQREEVPRKPDPSGALEIAGLMGIDPGKILFVGDSNNDILTAQAAGMIPLGVSWGYGRLETEAVQGDYEIIDNPAELWAYISNNL